MNALALKRVWIFQIFQRQEKFTNDAQKEGADRHPYAGDLVFTAFSAVIKTLLKRAWTKFIRLIAHGLYHI